MNEFFKFPSTKYIYLPDAEQMRADKCLTSEEIKELLSHEICIEEKIDGANLGISFDREGTIRLQNRGELLNEPFVGQWKKLGAWIEKRQDVLFDVLLDRYILFGEWCYATHSIYYDKLPDYFIGFDLYDKHASKFFSVERRNELLNHMGIAIIRQYGKGKYQLYDLPLFFSESYYGNYLCEGIYIRWDEDGWLRERAKLVRRDFQQSIGRHWRNKELQRNQLI